MRSNDHNGPISGVAAGHAAGCKGMPLASPWPRGSDPVRLRTLSYPVGALSYSQPGRTRTQGMPAPSQGMPAPGQACSQPGHACTQGMLPAPIPRTCPHRRTQPGHARACTQGMPARRACLHPARACPHPAWTQQGMSAALHPAGCPRVWAQLACPRMHPHLHFYVSSACIQLSCHVEQG